MPLFFSVQATKVSPKEEVFLERLHVFIQPVSSLLYIDQGLTKRGGHGRIVDDGAERALSAVNFGHDLPELLRGNLRFCGRFLQFLHEFEHITLGDFNGFIEAFRASSEIRDGLGDVLSYGGILQNSTNIPLPAVGTEHDLRQLKRDNFGIYGRGVQTGNDDFGFDGFFGGNVLPVANGWRRVASLGNNQYPIANYAFRAYPGFAVSFDEFLHIPANEHYYLHGRVVDDGDVINNPNVDARIADVVANQQSAHIVEIGRDFEHRIKQVLLFADEENGDDEYGQTNGYKHA